HCDCTTRCVCASFALALGVTLAKYKTKATTIQELTTKFTTLYCWKPFQNPRCVCNVSSFDIQLADPCKHMWRIISGLTTRIALPLEISAVDLLVYLPFPMRVCVHLHYTGHVFMMSRNVSKSPLVGAVPC